MAGGLKGAAAKKAHRNGDLEKTLADMSREDMTRLNAEVPSPLYKEFKKKCLEEDTTISRVVRDLIAGWVSK